jgi:hypothetical protein
MIQCRVELNEQNYRINQFSTKIVFWSKSFSKIFFYALAALRRRRFLLSAGVFTACGGCLLRLGGVFSLT